MVNCPNCQRPLPNGAFVCPYCPKGVGIRRPSKEAMQKYKNASIGFLCLGVIYLILSIGGSIWLKSMLLGFGISGTVGIVHGTLLLMEHEWVQSVTRVFCVARICMTGYCSLIVVFWAMSFTPLIFMVLPLFFLEIGILVLMIRIIDDIVFP